MSRNYTLSKKAISQRRRASKRPHCAPAVYLTLRVREESALRVRAAAAAAGISQSDLLLKYIPAP